MKRKGLLALALITLLVGISMNLPAAEKVRGVTDTEILIGQWGPQTGPAALWGAVARGSGVYFDLIN